MPGSSGRCDKKRPRVPLDGPVPASIERAGVEDDR